MPASETRLRIIEAARERFTVQGFAGFSVDELSVRLRISKKTFYKLFASRDDLIRQVAERTMAEVRAAIERVLESDADFVTKLHGLLSFFAQAAARLSRVSLLDLKKLSPEVWHSISEFRRDRIREAFGRLLEQGLREGAIRPEVNRRIFLLAYLGVVESILVPTVLAEESFSGEEAVRNVIDIFFRGVLSDEGRARFQTLQSQI